MSEDHVKTVERAIAAVNGRDIEGYLACCTEDIRLETPLSVIGGIYEGSDAIRRFFADLGDTSPDFHIAVDQIETVDADRIFALLRITATGRASGLPAADETPTGNVYDFEGGKIAHVRIFLDRDAARKAAGLEA